MSEDSGLPPPLNSGRNPPTGARLIPPPPPPRGLDITVPQLFGLWAVGVAVLMVIGLSIGRIDRELGVICLFLAGLGAIAPAALLGFLLISVVVERRALLEEGETLSPLLRAIASSLLPGAVYFGVGLLAPASWLLSARHEADPAWWLSDNRREEVRSHSPRALRLPRTGTDLVLQELLDVSTYTDRLYSERTSIPLCPSRPTGRTITVPGDKPTSQQTEYRPAPSRTVVVLSPDGVELLRRTADDHARLSLPPPLLERDWPFEEAPDGSWQVRVDSALSAHLVGAAFDWSAGSAPAAPPLASASAVLPDRVLAGETGQVRVRVENRGKGPVFRLLGRVTATDPAVNGSTLVFGRIDPGQILERALLPLPKDSPGGEVRVDVRFEEAYGNEPGPISFAVFVEPQPRPGLALSWRLTDDSSAERAVGNADGVLQAGETAELSLYLANVGEGPAETLSATLNVPEVAGLQVFGNTSWSVEQLAPGQNRTLTIGVQVKRGFVGQAITLEFHAVEPVFGKELREALSIPVGTATADRPVAIRRTYYPRPTSAALELRAGANGNSPVVARLGGAPALTAVALLGDWVKVQIPAGTEAGVAAAAKEAWARLADLVDVPPPLPDPTGRTAGQATAAPAQATVVWVATNIAPVVFLTSPVDGGVVREETVRLAGVVKDPDGQVASVKVYVGDRLVRREGSRAVGGVVPAAPKPGAPFGVAASAPAAVGSQFDLSTLAIDLPLAPGENRIRVVALDEKDAAGEAVATVTRQVAQGRLFVLAIGINDYEDPEIRALKFAEADARRVAEFYRTSGLILDPSHVRLLIGADATGSGIAAAIEEHLIRNAVDEEDAVILYYSGHGEEGAHPGRGTEYYLIPYDAQKRNLLSTAIDLERLQRLWEAVRCRTKVFLADSCNSGGFAGLKGDAAKDLTLALGEGKIALLASKPGQKAMESDQLRSGIFTHVLLDGLSGRADSNGDGRITVEEMRSHLAAQVPALARREGGVQEPYVKIEAAGEVVLGKTAK